MVSRIPRPRSGGRTSECSVIANALTRTAASSRSARVSDARENLAGIEAIGVVATLARQIIDSIPSAELEAYRFADDGRPVAELAFPAAGSEEDTGWLRWSIDAHALEAEPDAPPRSLGDPWPVEVTGVDGDAGVDELDAIDRRNRRRPSRRHRRRRAAHPRDGACRRPLAKGPDEIDRQKYAHERHAVTVDYLGVRLWAATDGTADEASEEFLANAVWTQRSATPSAVLSPFMSPRPPQTAL
jgi:hypothetical protein